MRERGAAWAIGACRAGGGGSWLRTPHLTSPLKGGRDELGKGEQAKWVLATGVLAPEGEGEVGLGGAWVSCLRRNDGKR